MSEPTPPARPATVAGRANQGPPTPALTPAEPLQGSLQDGLGRLKLPHIAGAAFRVSQPQQDQKVRPPLEPSFAPRTPGRRGPTKFIGNQEAPGIKYADFGLRASPRFKGETIEWTSCNDVTRKATIAGKNANASALAYVIKIESPSLRLDRSVPAHDDGWWGRVGDEFSFGPCTTPERAQAATEAFLRRDPLPAPRGNERYRKGNVWSLTTTASRAVALKKRSRKRSTASDARRSNLLSMARALGVPLAEVREMLSPPDALSIPVPKAPAPSSPPAAPKLDYVTERGPLSCVWEVSGARLRCRWVLPTYYTRFSNQ
jgi:hypothetical protein